MIKKNLFILNFIFFTCVTIYGAAEVRNITLSTQCINPGQSITVSFEVKCNAYLRVYGDILFSSNSVAEYSDDCVFGENGYYETPVITGHNGGLLFENNYSTSNWSTITKTIQVPDFYTDGKYLIINVAENYQQLFNWGSHIEGSSSLYINICENYTNTLTPTIVFPNNSFTVTPTCSYTMTQTLSPTSSNIIVPTITCTPTITIALPEVYKVRIDYKPGSDETNIIKPYFRLYNENTIPLDLSKVKIKYWYLIEDDSQNENREIYWVGKNSGAIDVTNSTFAEISKTNMEDQNRCYEITFSSSAGLLDQGQFVEVQSGIFKVNYSDYDQDNDWSYNSRNATSFESNGKITVNVDGKNIYGMVPFDKNQPVIINMNCGGAGFNDHLGILYLQGRKYEKGGWGSEYFPDILSKPQLPIAGTVDQYIYQNAVLGSPTKPLHYIYDNIPVGLYEVKFKFAEIDENVTSAGQNVFSIDIEDKSIFQYIDVFASAGFAYAYELVTKVAVYDGQLNIDFNGSFANGITVQQIYEQATPQTSSSATCDAWVDIDGVGQNNINVSNTGENSKNPWFEIDSNNHTHIMWMEYAAILRYEEWDGTSWRGVGGIGSGYSAVNTLGKSMHSYSFTMDGSGYPVVTFAGKSSYNGIFDIYCTRWNGSTWADVTGSGTSKLCVWCGKPINYNPYVKMDSLGNPHIAFHSIPSYGGRMGYIRWNGADWTDIDGAGTEKVVIDRPGLENSYNRQFVFDSANHPHLVWMQEYDGTGEINYMNWNGTNWVDVTGSSSLSKINISNNSTYSTCPQIVLDSSEYPNIIWVDGSTSSNSFKINFLKWNGTAWVDIDGVGKESQVLSFTNCSSQSVSMVLDNEGNPHVAWVDKSTNEPYYVYWNGTAWVDVRGSTSLSSIKVYQDTEKYSSASSAQLCLDNDGIPHIAWTNYSKNNGFSGEIYYLKWGGACPPTPTPTPIICVLTETSYGDNGELQLENLAASMTMDNTGKIVTSGNYNNNYLEIARYNQNGTKDYTFDGDGQVLTYIPGLAGNHAVIADENNKILATTRNNIDGRVMVRCLPNGQIDTTFGTNGYAMPPSGVDFYAWDMKIDSEGRIVAVGVSSGNNSPIMTKMTVCRYNPNGTLDLSFNGTGYTTNNISTTNPTLNTIGFGITFDQNNKIVIVGEGNNPTTGMVIWRFNDNGTLDTSFNATGTNPGTIVETKYAGSISGREAYIDGLGRILVTGSCYLASCEMAAIYRYNTDGSPDMSFGTGGYTAIKGNGNKGITTDKCGRILVLNTEGGLISRFNDDGTPDTTFNNGQYSISVANVIYGEDLILEEDGDIFVLTMERNMTDMSSNSKIRKYKNNSVCVCAQVTFTPTPTMNCTPSWQYIGTPGISIGIANNGGIGISYGTIYIGFNDYGNDGKTSAMFFNGSIWNNIGGIGFSNTSTSNPSFFVFNGMPYMAYADNTNGFKAKVMKYKYGIWIPVGSTSISDGEAQNLCLYVYDDGTVDGLPYLAFRDMYNLGKATVKRFYGSSWTDVGGYPAITNATAYYMSFYVYNNGTTFGMPYLAFEDSASGSKASVMKFNGTWTYVGGSPGASIVAGTYTSIYIYNNGTFEGLPYLAFSNMDNSYKANVIKFETGIWQVVGVQNFTTTGSSENKIEVYDDGLTIGGIPYLAYIDFDTTFKANVVKLVGSSWQSVGSANFTPSNIGQIFFDICKGIPYVSFVDWNADGKLSVMKYDCQ
ncbi:MAG: hypothetical protein LLG37_06755 [Spirochaetia bacterium]|nr:hypothetical protein [Spirochaetia bacterium]